MILIWSGEGGPLQLMGLAIFFLQFFAPQLFRLSVDIHQDGTIEFPFLWIACSLLMAIFLGGLWVVWDLFSEQEEEEEERVDSNNGSNASATEAAADHDASAPSGTAANPVVIDNDDDDFWTRMGRRVSSLLDSFSPTHLMLAMGIVLPLAMTAPLLLNGIQNDGLMGMLAVTVLAIIAHSMMAIAAYRVLRDVLDGEGVGPYPGTRGRRRRGRKLTVGEIADMVRKVPVEEFVSEEDIRTGECSIARMKRMLVNRGAKEAAEKCVERDDLVEEVEKMRNYNDECAICAEEYAEGEVLRVTHCRHEFHLHCFDKWIYTFATDSRPTHPTCPLCKATLQ
ncbi:hypothetical protein ACHAXR_013474 [Thalassiosira sp. AJA248-18]